jgi:hypothetical protein
LTFSLALDPAGVLIKQAQAGESLKDLSKAERLVHRDSTTPNNETRLLTPIPYVLAEEVPSKASQDWQQV